MTPFAGILRHDGQPIPDDWINTLLGRPSSPGTTWRVARDGSTAVAFARPTNPAEDAGGVIVAGKLRIDNRAELGERLGLRSPAPDDLDLVRAAYARWDDRCADQLDGDFAFVAWDAARRRLLLARDALGMHAIYYVESPTVFAFATDLRTLLALPFVSHRLSEDRVADMLRHDGSGPPDATFYADVILLPAAHTMVVEHGRSSLRRYWRASDQPSITLGHDADYAAALRERITTAVERRLHGGRTVAVHLSGGLDSASIACIAARALRAEGRRLLALCSVLPDGYDGPESDERRFIDAVLAQEDNIDVAWIQAPLDADVFGAHERWFEALGQPPFSTVTHIEQALGDAGRDRGVDIVLSGFGGDLFVSSRAQYIISEIVRAGRWALAGRELIALRRTQAMSWPAVIKQEIITPLLPSALRARRARRTLRPCVHPGLAERVDARRGQQFQPIARTVMSQSARATMDYILEPGRLESVTSAQVQVFATEFDQAVRFPLVDRRVIEFMLGVPPDQLQKDGWSRSLIRRAMTGIVPEVIRMRPDKGAAFDPAIMSRIVKGRERLADWVASTTERCPACWEYVDRGAFLEELAAVSPAARGAWRPGTFQTILVGGVIARFVEWHARSYQDARRAASEPRSEPVLT